MKSWPDRPPGVATRFVYRLNSDADVTQDTRYIAKQPGRDPLRDEVRVSPCDEYYRDGSIMRRELSVSAPFAVLLLAAALTRVSARERCRRDRPVAGAADESDDRIGPGGRRVSNGPGRRAWRMPNNANSRMDRRC